jgi:hypothetical protein
MVISHAREPTGTLYRGCRLTTDVPQVLMAEAPTARRAVVISAEETMSDSQAWIPVSRPPVHVPAGHHSRADHQVADPAQMVGGVSLEGELQELMCLAGSAFH